MPGLTSACGTMMAESAAVCLEDRDHRSGVLLSLAGMLSEPVLLYWPSVDDQQRWTYADMQDATEQGACGVAILLLKELLGKVLLSRSWKGTTFDYWVGDPLPETAEARVDLLPSYPSDARLEVSGILSGDEKQIAARAKQKRKQIQDSDHLGPGYVVVVEFGNPSAHVVVA